MNKTIVYNGKTFTLIKAKKEHRCIGCPHPILHGEDYWSITLNGAGLGSTKFPDRIHKGDCLSKYIYDEKT